MNDARLAELDELAYIEACELDSPNSIGFDALRERILDRLVEAEDGNC